MIDRDRARPRCSAPRPAPGHRASPWRASSGAACSSLTGYSPGDIVSRSITRRRASAVDATLDRRPLNRAAPYYIAGVAVAIGFKMNLFNIGVEGQYQLAALVAAAAGAARQPARRRSTCCSSSLVAMVVGAAWAGIAGVLKAYPGRERGDLTIMLNAIALGLAPFLLEPLASGSPTTRGPPSGTEPIPTSGRLPDASTACSTSIGIDMPAGDPSCSRTSSSPSVVGVVYYLLDLAHPLRLRPAGHRAPTPRPPRPAASTPSG